MNIATDDKGAFPFEKQWFSDLLKFGSFQAYEYLDGSKPMRDEARFHFENGHVKNPALDYPKLQEAKIRDLISGLTRLKQDVTTQLYSFVDDSQQKAIAQAYRWKVNEKLAEAKMLLASLTGNMRRFQLYSWFIYGKPSRSVFSSVIKIIKTRALGISLGDCEIIRTAATKLLSLLPPFDEESDEPFDVLPPAICQRIKELCPAFSDFSLGEDQIVDSAGVQKAFLASLASINATQWQVTCTPDKQAISVDHEQRVVWIPQDRTMTLKTLRGLVAHEIFTHVARRQHGESRSLRLLGLGLDRYEQAEEGIATIRESCFTSEMGTYHAHLAIGLAHGLDGVPRDFRDVYTILHLDSLLQQLEEGKNYADSEESAKKKAWNLCVRTFRGTNCNNPGVYFPKDMIYLEGRVSIRRLLLNDPNSMSYFNIGKYDPTNERHVRTLQALDII